MEGSVGEAAMRGEGSGVCQWRGGVVSDSGWNSGEDREAGAWEGSGWNFQPSSQYYMKMVKYLLCMYYICNVKWQLNGSVFRLYLKYEAVTIYYVALFYDY